MDDVRADDPSELTVLCWLLVLCELDALLWILTVRTLLSIF